MLVFQGRYSNPNVQITIKYWHAIKKEKRKEKKTQTGTHFQEIFSQRNLKPPLCLSIDRPRLMSNEYKPGECRQGDLPCINVQQ